MSAAEQVPASDSEVPQYGWRALRDDSTGSDSERKLTNTLIVDCGCNIVCAGKRTQSYDVEILSSGYATYREYNNNPFLAFVGLKPGKYEIKSLWRKNENRKFDRRFKVGQRGEKIYGKRDAEIKSFAIGLDQMIDSGDFGLEFVEQAHSFIDQAFERRHSKEFNERILRLAKASLMIPSITKQAQTVLDGGITGADIMKGFSDIEGIFIIAGPIYTLVKREEIPKFLVFNSASSEGPKLTYKNVIPSKKETKTNGYK